MLAILAYLLHYTNFMSYDIVALTPPMSVQATQSSSSAPVEVSWSPPSDGATNITGYRIFYGNGQSALVPSVAANIGLRVNRHFIGQNVSIRSESDQLYSELISVSITLGKCSYSFQKQLSFKS